jgi:pilus assembly protein CpaC
MSRADWRAALAQTSRALVRCALLAALMLVGGSSRLLLTMVDAQAAEDVQLVVIPLNKSKTLDMGAPFASAVVGNPFIADAMPMTDRKLYIQGKNFGTTNVSIFDENMKLVRVIDIEVAIDARNLQAKILAVTGERGIRVSNDNGQIVLSGVASNALSAERAVALAEAWGRRSGGGGGGGGGGGVLTGGIPGQNQTTINVAAGNAGGGQASGGQGGGANQVQVVNAMTVAAPQQVMLKVRFLEVDRNASRALGINWNVLNKAGTSGASTGLGGLTGTPPVGPPGNIFQTVGTLVGNNPGSPFGVVLAQVVNQGASIEALVTALETKGLLQRLAEPNLVALSGDSASFQAGGTIFIPTISSTTNGSVTPTVTPEQFGVLLQFRPTVLNNGIINVTLNPSVTELDFANATTISGTTVPALTVRSATTTVQLRDGQSFAIAGLLQADNTRDISQLPWLGSVPVLGLLFRSSAYQKDQTDLVIIVTPSLAKPAAPNEHLASPLDNSLPTNDVDFFVLGQTEQRKRTTDFVNSQGDIQGPYGYMLGVQQGANTSGMQK